MEGLPDDHLGLAELAQFSVASFRGDVIFLSSGNARSQAFRLSHVGLEMFERLVYRDLHRPDIVGGIGK